MREILFRGKHVDSGEWLEGDLLRFPDGVFYITYPDESMPRKNAFMEKINSETIGQYTGLTDKNGKKIFEGDVVKCTDETNDYSFTAVVMFGNPNGEYNWGFQLKRIKGANANTDILLWVEMVDTGAYIEVIGNIHDNPELLGGAE